MPLKKYDKYFGGKPGSATKAKKAMGNDSMFYATVNNRKMRGVKSHMPKGMSKNMRGGDIGKMRQEEATKAGGKWKSAERGYPSSECEASRLIPNRSPRVEKD